ncbi:hypothetical protein ISO42_17005 [Morganella morganii subsp. morganii]|uniref:hypothetical protein n=1 Tax=Morganella morganii TaxID=582 RepID=UPI001BDAB2E5|nr:hypothetical protein [Morganella morganii]MBT0513751.1 hypothetical protein [Morganella morganii subsp. morganii]UNJ80396.1 hypothetical protein [Morganella morganii]
MKLIAIMLNISIVFVLYFFVFDKTISMIFMIFISITGWSILFSKKKSKRWNYLFYIWFVTAFVCFLDVIFIELNIFGVVGKNSAAYQIPLFVGMGSNLVGFIVGLISMLDFLKIKHNGYIPNDDYVYSGTNLNPATGLPLIGSVDSAGNPIGHDLNNSDK